MSIGAMFSVLYSVVVYVIFLATFLYAIAFVGNLGAGKTIDSGVMGSPAQALIVDAALLALFAVQHSVMARPAFKRVWTRLIPKSVERSTYVLFASGALIVLYAYWQPITIPVWNVGGIGATLLHAVFWAGWGLVLLSTFLINHFELFGLSQASASLRGREAVAPAFKTPSLYRWVRHPIYLGFLLAFWATPSMTAGHLLFAIATSAYILLGIFFEERDLVAQFGEQYVSYRGKVGMLWPRSRRLE